MRIEVAPLAMLKLETACLQVGGLEVSGFGWVELRKPDFYVYDICILGVGNGGYTVIPPKRILPLLDRPDHHMMRLWWHRHPLGSGVPGPNNWSSMDENTARNEPLGTSPEFLDWSISMVRTPRGWVGRYDTYGVTGKTVHVDVTPSYALALTPGLSALKLEFTNREDLEDEKKSWRLLGREIDEEDEEEDEELWAEMHGVDFNPDGDFEQSDFKEDLLVESSYHYARRF